MKILLVDILRTSLEEVWPSAEHSLGLMYLAGALRREYGDDVHVRIWTLVSRPLHPEQDAVALREQLDEYRPDVLGIRCLSIGKDTFHRAAQTAKEWNPLLQVLAGGPFASDDPEDALRGGHVDCVVVGEGEVTLCALVERLMRGAPWDDVPGVAFLRNGSAQRTRSRELIADLDSLAPPDYSLVDLELFSNRFLTFSSKISKPHANIMTTRGCPYRCLYCHSILGKAFRTRTPASVLAELRHLHDQYGITDFQIIDDNFNLDLPRAKTICDLIVASGMKLTLSFPNAIRGDRVDEELIDKMAAAGTKFISYAVETGSPRLQKLIRKNLNLDQTFRAIEYTTATGIVTRGFFMLGFPTETVAEVERTIDFANASALCGATFFTVVYFPGTELYRLAQSMGYFQNGQYDVQRDYVNVGKGPYDFDLDTLIALKQRAIASFAFARERVERALALLPGYFTQREMVGFFMAYIVSSRASLGDIADERVRQVLKRYFVVADSFSKKNEYYV